MKVLSFNEIEFVKKILNLEKDGSLRPAWKVVYSLDKIIEAGYGDVDPSTIPKEVLSNAESLITKPPRFKIGESIQLHFKSRSPYQRFCQCHGIGFDDSGKLPRQWQLELDYMEYTIPKHFATAEITSVYSILVVKGNEYSFLWRLLNGEEIELTINDTEDFAKRDGFNSTKEFFQFFHKQYDISQPKKFWNYKFKLIENERIK